MLKQGNRWSVGAPQLFCGAVVLLLAASGVARPQTTSSGKVTIGILPFADSSGSGISGANSTALADQLRAQLAQTSSLAAQVLTQPENAAAPFSAEQAAAAGRTANVELVAVSTVQQAEAKSTQRGSISKSVFGVQIGSAKAATVSAVVRVQIDLIRSSDGQSVDSFTVEGTKSNASVSSSEETPTDLESADARSRDFQSTPLGQALQEALNKMSEELRARSAAALAKPSSVTPAIAGAAPAAAGASPSETANGSSGADSGGSANARSSRTAASGGSGSSSGGGFKIDLPSFSADEVSKTGKEIKNEKVWSNGGTAMRIEGVDAKGKKGTSIMRFDRMVVWVLMPEQKMYVELPLGNPAQWASLAKDAVTERTSLGSEQVGEYACEKFRVTVTLDQHKYTSLVWTAKALKDFTVKSQDEKGQWSQEYQNIHLGQQDPSLFELPAGYQKLNMGNMTRQPNP